MPLPHVCGVNTLPAATMSTASRRSPVIPWVQTQSGWNTSRQSRRSSSANSYGSRVSLAAGDRHVDPPAQLGHPVVVAPVQRLLHPVHALGGELARPPSSRGRRPTAGARPTASASPGCSRPSAPGCRRSRRGSPARRRGRRPAADARSAPSAPGTRARGPAGDVDHRRPSGRCTADDAYARTPAAVAAEQVPERAIGDLAGQVPQRHVERPRPAGVELDVGEHRGVAFEVERVLADEVRTRSRRTRTSTSPDPTPTWPASSWTRTIVAGKWVRGRGSHDAANGGSSGSRWWLISIAADRSSR